MPRQGGKRKTDSAIDYGKNDETAPDDETITTGAKKARMSSSNRTKRLSLLDDHRPKPAGGARREDQPGRFTFFDPQCERKASEAMVAKFQGRIDRQTDKMRQAIQGEQSKIAEKHHQFVTDLDRMNTAVKSSIPQVDEEGRNVPPRKQHILHAESDAIIEESRVLLAKFERAGDMLKSFDLALPLELWAQDKHDLAEIMLCGRDHGQHVVEGLLVPGMFKDPPVYDRGFTENQEVALGLLTESKKVLAGENWGTVFEEHLRRSVALANAVPADSIAWEAPNPI